MDNNDRNKEFNLFNENQENNEKNNQNQNETQETKTDSIINSIDEKRSSKRIPPKGSLPTVRCGMIVLPRQRRRKINSPDFISAYTSSSAMIATTMIVMTLRMRRC